jgi:DNA-binding SARP family transcriptional activator/TolB-like protein
MAQLTLTLLGDFSVRGCNGDEFNISSKKARALLAYLAVHAGRKVSRTELASLIWERHDEKQALTNLRQTLSVTLKELKGEDIKTGSSNWLHKDAGTLWLNLEEVEIDVSQYQLREAMTVSNGHNDDELLFHGVFLNGLSFHEVTLSDWVAEQRQYFQSKQAAALNILLAKKIAQQDYQQALITGEKLVSIDPIDEGSHQHLMTAYSALGQQHRVLRQYQQCCQALQACQIGQPQADTTKLFESLYHKTIIQPVFEIRPNTDNNTLNNVLNETPAIAVLQFKEFAVDTVGFSLGGALTEEIVTELRRFQGFKVILALSSMALHNVESGLESASKALGARYLVSGAIRQHNNRIQVGVELVDAHNGELIWAERYSRSTEDLFTLQVELARGIAGSIEPEANGHACLLSNKKSPASLTAWDLVLQGYHHFYKQIGTQWSSNKARTLYEQALALDPDYAPAYAGYAYSLCLDLKEDISNNRHSVEQKMREMAEHAVRLDSNNPWCKVVMGRVLHQLQEYDIAIKNYRSAVALCPSSSKAYFGLRFGLSATGQYEEAVSAMDRAHELSANHWAPLIQASSMVHTGRYNDAMTILDRVHQSKPALTAGMVNNAFPVADNVNSASISEALIEAGLTKD